MAVFSSMAGLLGGFDPVCVFDGGKMVAKHAISVHKRLPGFFPYLFEPHSPWRLPARKTQDRFQMRDFPPAQFVPASLLSPWPIDILNIVSRARCSRIASSTCPTSLPPIGDKPPQSRRLMNNPHISQRFSGSPSGSKPALSSHHQSPRSKGPTLTIGSTCLDYS